jgi:hypothetical protein
LFHGDGQQGRSWAIGEKSAHHIFGFSHPLDFSEAWRILSGREESVMSEFLPKEVRAGLEDARKRDIRRRSRLRVMTGDQVWPILRFWEDGFSLDADQVAHLRGHVDIFDGARHLYSSLIVASEVEGGELICVMKRSTAALDRPPVDFERSEFSPVALITRN